MNKKIYCLALGAVLGGMLVSCTNELNEPNNVPNQPGLLKVIKDPKVIAWSGDQVLSNTFNGTRTYATRGAEETFEYNYNFPVGVTLAENMTIPENAVEYTGNNQGSGTYKVSGEHLKKKNPYWGYDPGLKFSDNSTLTIYVEDGATVENIGNNITKIDLYILPGAEVTIEAPGSGVWNIYNAGTLNFPNGLSESNVKNVYNTGSIYFGENNTLASDVNVYTKGGYVEFGNNALINGTLVSDNIVQSNGKIKFQSSGYRDICELRSKDTVEITDGSNVDNYFGKILSEKDIVFDGCNITLHPEGYVNAKEEINIPNSNCVIKAYGPDYKGLVETPLFSINMINDPINVALPEGIYLNTQKFYLQSKGKEYTDFADIIKDLANGEDQITNESVDDLQAFAKRLNTNVTVHPSCSSITVGGGEKDECPGLVDPDHKCKHDGSIHNPDGTCPKCEEEGGPCYKEDDPSIKFPDDLDPGFGVTPEKPSIPQAGSEVEVNLSINDKDNQGDIEHLVSKLSIHVRYAGDVKVTMQMPAKYLVDKDDLYILNDHENFVYGAFDLEDHTVTYEIYEGKFVTLTVSYDIPEDGGMGSITVTTSGIDQEVFDYCVANYYDGINFEVYNYYNKDAFESTTFVDLREELKYYLNKATVEFLGSEEEPELLPDYYINAFNDFYYTDEDGNVNNNLNGEKDCKVEIIGEQADSYNEGEVGPHLNNGEKNVIYQYKDREGYDESTNQHGHGFLWGDETPAQGE